MIKAAVLHAIRDLGFTDLREKQSEVMESFLGGQNVFGVLPTNWLWQKFMLCLPSWIL
jgi:superfamily II DNA helicase RecQ